MRYCRRRLRWLVRGGLLVGVVDKAQSGDQGSRLGGHSGLGSMPSLFQSCVHHWGPCTQRCVVEIAAIVGRSCDCWRIGGAGSFSRRVLDHTRRLNRRIQLFTHLGTDCKIKNCQSKSRGNFFYGFCHSCRGGRWTSFVIAYRGELSVICYRLIKLSPSRPSK